MDGVDAAVIHPIDHCRRRNLWLNPSYALYTESRKGARQERGFLVGFWFIVPIGHVQMSIKLLMKYTRYPVDSCQAHSGFGCFGKTILSNARANVSPSFGTPAVFAASVNLSDCSFWISGVFFFAAMFPRFSGYQTRQTVLDFKADVAIILLYYRLRLNFGRYDRLLRGSSSLVTLI